MTKVARPRFNAFDTAEFSTQESIYIGDTYVGQINFVKGCWTTDREYIGAHWVCEDGKTFKVQQSAAIHQMTFGRAVLLAEKLGF
jgi:hypothetical protein